MVLGTAEEGLRESAAVLNKAEAIGKLGTICLCWLKVKWRTGVSRWAIERTSRQASCDR
jgi:hypothetical protein